MINERTVSGSRHYFYRILLEVTCTLDQKATRFESHWNYFTFVSILYSTMTSIHVRLTCADLDQLVSSAPELG